MIARMPLIVGAMIASTPMIAQAQSPHNFSANVGFFSDYIYRGISQTDRGPAIQGGFDYGYDVGGGYEAYLGVWGSNIEFNDGQDLSVEIDLYGGITGELMDSGITWDVGGIYYFYPKDDLGYDFGEAYVGLGYTFEELPLTPTLSTYVSYSPEFSGDTGTAYYINPTLGLSLPHEFTLDFGYGYQDVDDIGSYSNWSVGISRQINIFNVGVSFSQTFDDDGFCAGNPNCQDTFLFSVSSSF